MTTPETFDALGLGAPLLRAVLEQGYEAPTPIQARAIPALLAGRDVLGEAQTGTGKTAAFALPMLERLTPDAVVQGLILAPTRELAIQVAEAIHVYARHLPHVRVAPIYGGQPMATQIRRLRSGLHVVVGTPGRLLDHLRRGTLDLSGLTTVVLDEADEMLRMGFLEDVETILAELPVPHQTALFSATMPAEIVRVTERYLNDPVYVAIERPTVTVPTTEQRYLNVSERQKLDALARLLEVEETDAVLVFVRTKTGAADLAERLQRRGWDVEPMHGDMTQVQREAVIRRLRGGQVDVVVATDVAARGLDVERITHVVNYDIPNDPGSYVHRVGRTGRAGRAGTTVLFVTPRETRLLREIERYTGQRIEPMKVPTQADVAARRIALFKERLRTTITAGNLEPYLALVEEVADDGPFDIAEVAAAAARLAEGDRPLHAPGEADASGERDGGGPPVRLLIDAGREHGIRPADVVGAVANEADIPGAAIGGIEIRDRFTVFEVPARYRHQVLSRMAGARIRNRPVTITEATRPGDVPDDEPARRQAKRGAPRERRRPPRDAEGGTAGRPRRERPGDPRGRANQESPPRGGDRAGLERERDARAPGGPAAAPGRARRARDQRAPRTPPERGPNDRGPDQPRSRRAASEREDAPQIRPEGQAPAERWWSAVARDGRAPRHRRRSA
jgi:ATP-dependent RNA helicase DeaD